MTGSYILNACIIAAALGIGATLFPYLWRVIKFALLFLCPHGLVLVLDFGRGVIRATREEMNREE